MDVHGARVLRERIDKRQREHWQTAPAVQTGEQAADDPDGEHVVRLRDTVREYEPRPGERFVKILVDGRWVTSQAA